MFLIRASCSLNALLSMTNIHYCVLANGFVIQLRMFSSAIASYCWSCTNTTCVENALAARAMLRRQIDTACITCVRTGVDTSFENTTRKMAANKRKSSHPFFSGSLPLFLASYVRYLVHILQHRPEFMFDAFRCIWICSFEKANNTRTIRMEEQQGKNEHEHSQDANVKICTWNNNFGYSIEMEHKKPLNSPHK